MLVGEGKVREYLSVGIVLSDEFFDSESLTLLIGLPRFILFEVGRGRGRRSLALERVEGDDVISGGESGG